MIYSILSTYLLDPITWVLLLLVAALILRHHKRERASTVLIAATAVFLLALMIVPLDEVISRPLENRYPRPTLPPHIDGIVVLSGGLNPYIFAHREVPGPNATTQRFLAGVELARRFPNARLVFTGMEPGGKMQREAEHEALWDLVDSVGLPRSRITVEDKSTTTAENIGFCQRLLHPRKGETWLLVTSAIHMPRAMATAQQAGWTMIPWPSDYKSSPTMGETFRVESSARSILQLDAALHEWVGLLVYRLRGWAD